MRWRNLEFVMREMMANIWRQRLSAAAAVLSLTAAALIAGAGALAMLNVNRWISVAGGELRVWAHLSPNVARDRARELQALVARWPQVSSCELRTREQEWHDEQEWIRHPALGMVPNPLGDALRIRARQPADLTPITGRLRAMPEVETVVDARQAQRWISKAARAVEGGTALGGCLLGIVAVAVFVNTLRLTLHARRREIAVMQLVGATGGFVAAPFVLEGLLLGLVGSAVASAALLGVYAWSVEQWPAVALNVSLIPARQAAVLAWLLIGAGGLLGLLGGGLSVRRYLRLHLAGEVSF